MKMIRCEHNRLVDIEEIIAVNIVDEHREDLKTSLRVELKNGEEYVVYKNDNNNKILQIRDNLLDELGATVIDLTAYRKGQ